MSCFVFSGTRPFSISWLVFGGAKRVGWPAVMGAGLM